MSEQACVLVCWRTKESETKGQMTFISNVLVAEENDAYFKDGLTTELHLHIASYSVPQTVSQTISIGVLPQEKVLWPDKFGICCIP